MKPKSKSAYERQFREAITARFGSYNPGLYGLAVAKAAKDFHLLDLYDEEIEKSDFTQIQTGSTGQIKTEINPLLAMRDKASRTAQDALDALMLTPRSTYKKNDGEAKSDCTDPMAVFFGKLNQ